MALAFNQTVLDEIEEEHLVRLRDIAEVRQRHFELPSGWDTPLASDAASEDRLVPRPTAPRTGCLSGRWVWRWVGMRNAGSLFRRVIVDRQERFLLEYLKDRGYRRSELSGKAYELMPRTISNRTGQVAQAGGWRCGDAAIIAATIVSTQGCRSAGDGLRRRDAS